MDHHQPLSAGTDAGEASRDAARPANGQCSAGAALASRLWREHRGWVAAVVRANMPRGADPDDLLQEVAVKLVQHIDSLDSPERIGPWLRTVATNIARTAGRRHVRSRNIFQPLAEYEPEAKGDERSDAAARGRHALRIAETLPSAYREPLLLSLRGLSYKQIALALDLPVSTIETRLSRARAMVREELKAADDRDIRRDAARSAHHDRAHQRNVDGQSCSIQGKASVAKDEHGS